MNEPKKLECHKTRARKGSLGTNTLAYWAHSKVRMNLKSWPYSEHFIIFITYEWAQKARVLIILVSKGMPGANTQAYWAHS
jgi:hypothetical protein